MTRGRGAWALAAVLAAGPALAGAAPLPYRLAVDVRWGAGGGPEAFREDVARALADAFSGRCYASAARASDEAPADLRLAVALSGLREQLRFLDSIATSLAPGDPGTELRRVAVLDLRVDAALETAEGAAPIQTKHFVVSLSRQPLILGEDPQAVARALAVDRIVDDLGKAICKGGDKLDKKIKAAMAEPADTSPR